MPTRLFGVAFNQPQTNTVFSVITAGNTTFKNMIANTIVNTTALIGYFNQYFIALAVNQTFNFTTTIRLFQRGIKGVIQQITNNGNPLIMGERCG